jgi:hypothetical protein
MRIRRPHSSTRPSSRGTAGRARRHLGARAPAARMLFQIKKRAALVDRGRLVHWTAYHGITQSETQALRWSSSYCHRRCHSEVRVAYGLDHPLRGNVASRSELEAKADKIRQVGIPEKLRWLYKRSGVRSARESRIRSYPRFIYETKTSMLRCWAQVRRDPSTVFRRVHS